MGGASELFFGFLVVFRWFLLGGGLGARMGRGWDGMDGWMGMYRGEGGGGAKVGLGWMGMKTGWDGWARGCDVLGGMGMRWMGKRMQWMGMGM